MTIHDISRYSTRVVLVAAALWLLSTVSTAQVPPDVVQQDVRGIAVLPREPEDLPRFLPPPPDEAFELPRLARPADPDRPATALSIVLNDIRVSGNTVLPADAVNAVTDRYLGQRIDSAGLQQLRYELTQLYIQRGYINSGIILPDQRISDGTVEYQAVEGTLSSINLTVDGRLKPAYLRRQLDDHGDTPLNVFTLRESLQLLQQDALVDRIQSALLPGDRPGAAVLNVEVAQARALRAGVRVDNARAPSIGGTGAVAFVSHANLTGRGDELSVQYGVTDGLDDASASYTAPVSGHGARLRFSYRMSRSDVVEEPFDEIDIASETEEAGISLDWPLVRSPGRSLSFGIDVGKARSETSLLGRPFSFSPGVVDGQSDVTTLRLRTDWLRRRANSVIALRSTFSFGIDALDATINDGAPDSRFTSWLGQFQWVTRFGEGNNQLIVRSDVQLSADPLLPIEKFALGGASTVRGYRENLLVRDNGWLVSAELRRPVATQAISNGTLQLSAFADLGRGWNKNGPSPRPDSISAAGLGLLWSSQSGVSAELFGAVPFRTADNGRDDLQDKGIHFRLGWALP